MRVRQARFAACFLRLTTIRGRYFGVLRSLWTGLRLMGFAFELNDIGIFHNGDFDFL